MQVLLQMRIQLRQLHLVEQCFAADVVHAQQFLDTALLVALEIGAHRLRIDQQRIGDIGRCASLAKQNHRIDAVRFSHVQRPAVGRA